MWVVMGEDSDPAPCFPPGCARVLPVAATPTKNAIELPNERPLPLELIHDPKTATATQNHRNAKMPCETSAAQERHCNTKP